MTHGTTQTETSFGFLTILEPAAGGMLGGLLIVNRRGRPLEFHCTAPIVPSRAEEILFGRTLRPHLYCERIGTALLKKLARPPAILVVNQLDAWPIADETATPVVLVDPRATGDGGQPCGQAPPAPPACLDRIEPVARSAVERQLGELARYVDLAEPFERIAEAIREAGLLDAPAANDTTTGEVAYDAAA